MFGAYNICVGFINCIKCCKVWGNYGRKIGFQRSVSRNHKEKIRNRSPFAKNVLLECKSFLKKAQNVQNGSQCFRIITNGQEWIP